jgi:hypothetical protein
MLHHQHQLALFASTGQSYFLTPLFSRDEASIQKGLAPVQWELLVIR